jgi:Right handed beta helix region
LLHVHPFNTNEQGSGPTFAGNDHAFSPSFADAGFKICFFKTDLLHRISSVVLCGGLCRITRTTTVDSGCGFGVQVDADQPGPFCVSVKDNSIHDYTRNGVYVTGAGVTARIENNTISGIGPAVGTFQFGVFVLNGAVGLISRNVISEGLCGTLSLTDCISLRSEGVTLRAVGDGTEVSNNVITNAQSGIFINGVNHIRVTNNLISNIEGADGIDAQGTSNSLFDGNIIFNAGPVSAAERGNGFVNISCGILEAPGEGTAGGTEEDNQISHTTVNDAYCGVGHVATTHVEAGEYHNTLYPVLASDSTSFPPPPVEP